jgi:hypothetical protein
MVTDLRMTTGRRANPELKNLYRTRESGFAAGWRLPKVEPSRPARKKGKIKAARRRPIM